jgi:hypothetical protein
MNVPEAPTPPDSRHHESTLLSVQECAVSVTDNPARRSRRVVRRPYAASQAARSRFNFIMSASRVYIMWPAS